MSSSTAVPIRKPNPYLMAVRLLVLTIGLTLFCFAIGLFFGIIGVVIANAVRGGGINLNLAYRAIAFPFAMVGLVAIFATLLVYELRRYRRQRDEYRAFHERAA